MRTKIITSFYSNLHGTELGGRQSRDGHYKYSLRSLLKMSDAKFICYTSSEQIDEIKRFFYDNNKFTEDQIEFKIFDLRKCEYHQKINKVKKTAQNVLGDRCYEIQYQKFNWCLENCDEDTDYVFWFDAGLSHTGLIPNRYLDQIRGYWEKYYESNLFNNHLLTNLITHTEDKIVVCAKENNRNHWSKTIPKKYYVNYSWDHHIIGGFFGGTIELMKTYCELVIGHTHNVLDNESNLYLEENVMSMVFYNYRNLFKPLFFDIWWHEDDNIPGINLHELTKTEKSFYKILEELNGKFLSDELKQIKQNKIKEIYD